MIKFSIPSFFYIFVCKGSFLDVLENFNPLQTETLELVCFWTFNSIYFWPPLIFLGPSLGWELEKMTSFSQNTTQVEIIIIISTAIRVTLRVTKTLALRGCLHEIELAPARVSHWDDLLITYRVYMMTGSFHILLFNGTFHVNKIHVCLKIANITHALPVPVYRQTDFTPKWVVISRLHDTVARFRTGVKSSPRCKNRG